MRHVSARARSTHRHDVRGETQVRSSSSSSDRNVFGRHSTVARKTNRRCIVHGFARAFTARRLVRHAYASTTYTAIGVRDDGRCFYRSTRCGIGGDGVEDDEIAHARGITIKEVPTLAQRNVAHARRESVRR